MITCEVCGRKAPRGRRGPQKRYCGQVCRDHAKREREKHRQRRRAAARKPAPPVEIDPPRVPVARPTDARPGTPEKIVVLMARAAAGEELWHEHDASYGGSPC